MASATGSLSVTFASDPTSAPPLDATGALGVTFSADPVSVVALLPTATGVLGATFLSDPTSAPPLAASGSLSITFAAEPVTAKPEEILGNSGFGGQVVLTTDTGLEITFPYSDDLDVETLSRRVTATPTLDTGVYIYDAGYSDTDREVELVIEAASRAQIDTAKAIMLVGAVSMAHWDGYYTGYVQSMSALGGDLTITVLISAKLN